MTTSPDDALFYGRRHRGQSDSPSHRRQAYSASLDDVRPSLSANRNFDIATHPVRVLVGEAKRIRRR